MTFHVAYRAEKASDIDTLAITASSEEIARAVAERWLARNAKVLGAAAIIEVRC
jgi:hypothetical protein